MKGGEGGREGEREIGRWRGREGGEEGEGGRGRGGERWRGPDS